MTAFENPKHGGASGDGEKRVRCMYCGANNFPSSPTCWQCNRPLQPLRGTPDPAGAVMPPLSRATPGQAPLPTSRPLQNGQMESALAPKAAATLGLMFPYVGLPVGIVFLMLDDPRKTQLGWITIGWSVAGTIASTLLLIPLLAPVMAFLKGLIPHGGRGGGLPNIPMPGGEDDPGLILLQITHSLLANIQAFGH